MQMNEAWEVAKASGDEDYTKFKAKWFQDEKRRKAQEAQAQAEAPPQTSLFWGPHGGHIKTTSNALRACAARAALLLM